MLTYSFTDIGSDTLYNHLYKCIKNDILSGILAPGSRLPSKRSLAKNLGISVITVESAYGQLVAEGYIYSLPKKGFFVADISQSKEQQNALLSSENIRLSSGETSYIANFSSNQTDSENFPFSIWAKLIREILNENQKELVTNPPCGGILQLRQAIADHLKGYRNLHIEPEQIIIGAGTEYLYGLLIQLLGWASKSPDRYIIEDDYDSEFRMTGQPIPALQDIDVLERVIYINTFTKTLSSTVRISYMVLPKSLVNRFYKELSFYSCTVSNFEQYTLARFIEDGYFEKHLNRMRNYYHAKRDHLLNCIRESKFSSYVEIMEEDAGLHFIMKIDTSLSDREFCMYAEQKGIKLSALSHYYSLPTNVEHYFVINYSSVQEEHIAEAIQILYELARK